MTARRSIAAVGGTVSALAVAVILLVLLDEDNGIAHERDRPFAELARRPLRLPEVNPAGDCPTAAAISLRRMESERGGIPAEAALGPGDATRAGLRLLRRGPVYVAFQGTPRFLDFFPPEDSTSNGQWRSAEVLWLSRPSYRGPTLVRGRQLDGRARLGFGDQSRPRRQRRLPPGSWMEERRALRAWGQTIKPRKGWRAAVSTVRIAPTGRHQPCYGFQVDGKGFSYPIVFWAVLQPSAP